MSIWCLMSVPGALSQLLKPPGHSAKLMGGAAGLLVLAHNAVAALFLLVRAGHVGALGPENDATGDVPRPSHGSEAAELTRGIWARPRAAVESAIFPGLSLVPLPLQVQPGRVAAGPAPLPSTPVAYTPCSGQAGGEKLPPSPPQRQENFIVSAASSPCESARSEG